MISGAEKRGVRVPQDLAIVGVDNLSFAPFTRPALASVGIPRMEIAEASIAILHQLVTDTTADTHAAPRQFIHTISTRFILRASAEQIR